jgi:hypothetical protein
VPQTIKVDGILVAAGDRRGAPSPSRVLDAVRVAAIQHRCGKPTANPERALRLWQKQQTAIRRVIVAVKINSEFLAQDGWKVAGKQRIFGSRRLWRWV